ncbi:hypothetical protein QTP88_015072 [Uroleucon formosanum]
MICVIEKLYTSDSARGEKLILKYKLCIIGIIDLDYVVIDNLVKEKLTANRVVINQIIFRNKQWDIFKENKFFFAMTSQYHHYLNLQH